MKSKYFISAIILITHFLTSCSGVAIGDKMFVRKIDKEYSFSKMKDSTLAQFKIKFGNDFVYRELDSDYKRVYISHMIYQNRDLYFPKPPLYFEFKNDKMTEFGVVKPGFLSLIFKRFENGVKIVKREKIFRVSKKK